MFDLDRLIRFVHDAPTGTMVPVESLRELIAEAEAKKEEGRPLTPDEAAEWLHRRLGGRKRTGAAVRKVMRTGFRGVILESHMCGRERRTTEADLVRFVAQISGRRSPVQSPVVERTGPQLVVSAGRSHGDPADEIAEAQARFGGATSKRERGQRSGSLAVGAR